MFRVIKSAGLVVTASAALIGGAASAASADAGAYGHASHSPGVLSGNVVQVPIHIPINVCGNSVNLVGALNPTFGNVCVNGDHHQKHDGGHYDEGYRG